MTDEQIELALSLGDPDEIPARVETDAKQAFKMTRRERRRLIRKLHNKEK